MGKFLENEKHRQTEFKANSPYFSEEARTDGLYKSKLMSFCLPVDYAEENLFTEIRKTCPAYFADFDIKWHDGQNGKPSSHLCDSQVCCVNFLFPFAKKSHLLSKILKPIFPEFQEMLPIENEQYVAFEWIGLRNYLGEKIPLNGKRTRGANYTSADAIVKFKRIDGKIQIALIEWKYTESYGSALLKVAPSGTDRTKIYEPLYLQNDCPINKELLESFDLLFYEPFYQFMRQQLLAYEMEKVHEMGADVVNVLHIAPMHNTDFHKITSPGLAKVKLGETAIEIWKKLVKGEDRFISIRTETLFSNLLTDRLPETQEWRNYICKRYSWVQED